MTAVGVLAKLKVAGAWIVSHWKLFLFPLGVLVWLVGKASGKTVVQVQSPALEEHEALKTKLDTETKAKIEGILVEKAKETELINQNFEQVSKKLDDAEARQAAVLQKDPDALNDFLKGVGRDVRTKPRV